MAGQKTNQNTGKAFIYQDFKAKLKPSERETLEHAELTGDNSAVLELAKSTGSKNPRQISEAFLDYILLKPPTVDKKIDDKETDSKKDNHHKDDHAAHNEAHAEEVNNESQSQPSKKSATSNKPAGTGAQIEAGTASASASTKASPETNFTKMQRAGATQSEGINEWGTPEALPEVQTGRYPMEGVSYEPTTTIQRVEIPPPPPPPLTQPYPTSESMPRAQARTEPPFMDRRQVGSRKFSRRPGRFSRSGLSAGKKAVTGAVKKEALAAASPLILPIAIGIIIFLLILIPVFIAARAANDPIFAGQLALEFLLPRGGPEPTPTPTPNPNPNPQQSPPEIINFKGGSAYLTCDKKNRSQCPVINKGDLVTAYAIFKIDNNFTGNKDKALITIGPFSPDIFDFNTDFYKNITPKPDIHGLLSPNYTWKLSTLMKSGETGSSPNEYIISMGIGKPLKNGSSEITLSLKGFESVTGDNGTLTGDLGIGMSSPPTTDPCGLSHWELPNFGDPLCSYSPASWRKVLDLTETKHPDFIPFWLDIANTEGNINTRGGGTYGKFQMNAGNPKYTQIKLDDNMRGDVPWQRQIQNAVSRNNYLISKNNTFGFWGTAMCLCYFDYYRNSDKGKWCNDIINHATIENGVHSVRCPRECANKSNPGSPSCSDRTDNKGKEHGKINCSQYACWDGNKYGKH